MFRPLYRTTTRHFRPLPRHQLRTRPRTYTSKPPSTSSVPTSAQPAVSPRLAGLLSRTPRFLHRHIHALSSAPLSHITSFLLLHELTAIVPLFSLAALFHYTYWLPSWFAEGAWVLAGVEKFGGYARRKGWIGEEGRREAGREVVEARYAADAEGRDGSGGSKANKAFNIGEGGVRIVVEFATAYAVTKALLVPRIMFSVWATPAFARWTVVPVMRWVRGVFGNKKKKGGGTLPKSGDGKTP